MVTGSRRRSLKFLLAALTAAVLFVITALPAAAMTVTFVRHGESEANASHTIDNSIPGARLTPLGQAQAATVAAALTAGGVDYDAIYTSNMVRTAETAAPFAAASGLSPTVLPGVREINAGWFEGWSDSGFGGIGYVLAPALWTLGARSIPVPGGGDGNAFDARMDGALQIIEDSGAQNPVVFSHAATIMFWTMMNVDNPDLGLMLRHRLDNTEMVVIEGSAEEGWTLTNWAGHEVGPATLPTKLLVNFRDLLVTPQTAAYDVARAFRTGDIGTIAKALRDGVGDVLKAPVKFVTAVVRDVVEAVRPSAPNNTTTELNARELSAPRIAAPEIEAEVAEPESELEPSIAPVKKPRTTRTVKKSGRPATTLSVRDTTELKRATRPDEKPADKPSAGGSGTEKDAA